jgi:predicted alpha-1,2-mannosidase
MRRLSSLTRMVCLSLLGAAACGEPETTGGTTTTETPEAGPPAVVRRPSEPVAPLFVGSGGFGYNFGSAFAGAAAPAGLVKVGPDTRGPWGTLNFLHYSGYWYGDDFIQGFSHMHLHGTGATDYGVLSFMPSDGFDASRTTAEGYESPFEKVSESSVPGLYAVTLGRGDIQVEIAATRRAAHHRYTYPAGAGAAHVIVDLDHHLSGGSIESAEVTLSQADGTFAGSLHSMGGMSDGFGGYTVYFAARAKAPWQASQVWQGGSAPAAGAAASGQGVGFDLEFDLSAGSGPVEIAIGLSTVSAAGAKANLDAEIPAFDLDATAKATGAAWDELLGRVSVSGGHPDDAIKMEAAMYHLFLMPSIHGDVDGSYRAMDGSIQKADGFEYMTDLSLWDTYRTLHPIYDLFATEYARNSVLSLHEKAKSGGFFPKWPIAHGEAGTMLGSSAEVVLADAYVKGMTDFDAEGAYQILRAAAMDQVAPPGGRGGRGDVEPYMAFGYVPSSRGRSVSMTTEYANDDFALAALAEGLGHAKDAAVLRGRALGYRALFDPETGFLWAKDEAGEWATPHTDATAFSDEFAEANAWHSLWMVAEDIDGLAELSGGREALVAKAEEMFVKGREEHEGLDYSLPLSSGGARLHYWGANEPDINAPYVFSQLGRPDLTQRWVAWCRAFLYTAGADGLPGNDDGGTMSAWFVFSALGFYPIPATDRYIVGTPLFSHAEIAVAGGVFTIDAAEVSDDNVYVQSVTLNGSALEKAEFRHSDLKAGGSLVFEMGPAPGQWGRDKGD